MYNNPFASNNDHLNNLNKEKIPASEFLQHFFIIALLHINIRVFPLSYYKIFRDISPAYPHGFDGLPILYTIIYNLQNIVTY